MNVEDPEIPPIAPFPGSRSPRYQGLRRSIPDPSSDKPKDETQTEETFDPSNREATIAAIKTLIQEGKLRRLMIKDDDGNILFETSLTTGILGSLLFPSIASFIGLAAMAKRRKIVVERISDSQ